MKRKYKKTVLWSLTVVWMLVIFSFSSQNGEESDKISGGITREVTGIFVQNFDELPETDQELIINRVNFAIRKLAHFSEYTILGFLLFFLVRCYRKGGKAGIFLPLAFGAAYAVSDELHQLFSEGRSPKLLDVFIDSSGVFCGILCGFLILFIAGVIDKRRQKGIS